ncbi:MAG: ABC transporter ATP-binding protein [Lachnospiraceae bacterium]|nr:ABC transporter ATP-binding protein [Lachnospiraceae bacterium]
MKEYNTIQRERECFFEIHNITAGYGKKEMIHNINFSLNSHTLTCLIGANGSGKTTLLKSIANQLSHQGTCSIEGESLEQKSVKELARDVSYIPQKTGISISMSVLDVVLMGYNARLKLLENPSKKQIQQACEVLSKIGLEKEIDTDYLNLSEGQKQLVILARMMIENTKILLLDEPDSALDVPNRFRMMSNIRHMVDTEEKAGILCLHDPMLALEFCDQLVLLKAGKCIGILYPKKDSIGVMEKAFCQVYGNVSLMECFDKEGKRHFSMIGI